MPQDRADWETLERDAKLALADMTISYERAKKARMGVGCTVPPCLLLCLSSAHDMPLLVWVGNGKCLPLDPGAPLAGPGGHS